MKTQVSVHPRIKAARDLCDIFRQSNFKAYWVGGAVRDLVLQPDLAPVDIDIATDASFKEICNLLPRTRAIGKAFGVGLVSDGEFNFEIATFRKESDYADRRHPSQVGPGTLQEDSERRDFTINALYFDPLDELILDMHGGLNDLQARLLRCVGDSQTRLHEDPLRILRLFRFAARLGFQIENTTLTSALRLAPELRFISKERILLEISKLSPRSAGSFAQHIQPFQSSLLGTAQSQGQNDSSGKTSFCFSEPTVSVQSYPATLFAVICASNEGFSKRNWPKTFKDWPLSGEERAHVELFQRTGEGLFCIPQTSAESDWTAFLENFRWLQRQSRISLAMADWLSQQFEPKAEDGTKFSALNLISSIKRICTSQDPENSINTCLEDAIQFDAKPLREKVQSQLANAPEKSAVSWGRLMIDCGVLLRLINWPPSEIPDFLSADSDEKIALLCATAMRWSQSKSNGKKKLND
jgi:hypothetical protein